MRNIIEWVIDTLAIDGINSKSLVRTTLEEMSIDDWYDLRDECNNKIQDLRSKGFKPEDDPNILLLRSYKSDMYQCNILQREIDILSNFVKGPNYDGMPLTPSKVNNPVEQQHISLIDAKHRLEKILANKSQKLERCLDLINTVNDSRSRFILVGIFLDNKTLYQIMEEAPFDLSYKQICRLKKAGLDEIRKLSKV